MDKYRDTLMDLADASLLAVAESNAVIASMEMLSLDELEADPAVKDQAA